MNQPGRKVSRFMVSKVAGPPIENNVTHAQQLFVDHQQELLQDQTKCVNLIYDTVHHVEESLSKE